MTNAVRRISTLAFGKFAGLAFAASLVIVPGSQTAEAQTYHVLYSFTGGADGGQPQGPLFLQSGQLFGITPLGGATPVPGGYGTIFEIELQGAAVHGAKEITLYTFPGQNSLESSNAGLVGDSAGNLYGVTPRGGANGQGAVFQVNAAGTMSVLHSFAGPDGGFPVCTLTRDSAGNLYGTTEGGGSYSRGTVFKLEPNGDLVTLHNFRGGADGRAPMAGLLFERGELYGTTELGGQYGRGTVFRVNASSGAERVLYHFTGGADGDEPLSGLSGDSAGNLYGTTPDGGKIQDKGANGVVFAIAADTGQERVLHTFSGPDGKSPIGELARDAQGNLYGATLGGGANGQGTIFMLDPSGNFTVLHSFSGKGDGASPVGGVVIGPTGRLYGTTRSGGKHCTAFEYCGTVFELTP
jgi:uncharacterized repeat protein (TIGR03803 family)